MKPNVFIIALAILALTAIEICAIFKGINGKLMLAYGAIIGGIAVGEFKHLLPGIKRIFK